MNSSLKSYAVPVETKHQNGSYFVSTTDYTPKKNTVVSTCLYKHCIFTAVLSIDLQVSAEMFAGSRLTSRAGYL